MKTIIIGLLMMITLPVAAQQKDTTQPKLAYLVMPIENWKALLAIIKTADEKPSVLKDWVNLIVANLQELKEEKKEEKKK